MARVKWSTASIRYIDSMWSNTEDWQEIRKSPELVTMFGGIGQEWVSKLNTELHEAQARRKQKIEDGYKFAIRFDEDRLRMRIWCFTARAQAHEAKHQSILRLMHTSGFDVKEKSRARFNWGGGGTGGGRSRGRARGSAGSGSGGKKSKSTSSRPKMDPQREARLRRQLITLDALQKDSAASEGEKRLAAERARRFRSELGE